MPSLLDPDEGQTLAQTGAGLLRIGQDDGSDQGAALADLYRRVTEPQAQDVTPRWDADNPVGTETTQALRQATPIVSPERYQAHAQVQQAMELAPTIALGMLGDAPGIRGYHGSGADFNAFDDRFIGTGEGNQSFGYGHYVAGQEGVARTYRDAAAPIPSSPQEFAAEYLHATGGDRDAAIALLADHATGGFGWTKAQMDGIQGARDLLKSGADVTPKPPGHMYEVNIAADPAHFLDWDKPLSEQSQHVQDAIRDIGKIGTSPLAWQESGGDWYRGYAGDQEGAMSLAQSMHAAGIPGIRYLDAGSRGAQPPVKLVGGKPYDPADPTHGAAQALQWTNGDRAAAATQLESMAAKNPASASDMQRAAAVLRSGQDVPRLTEGPGPGTHNTVVFDPATIEILRKYGIAGLGLGLGAAATQQGNGT
jgi:hypothetical protein